MFVRDCFDRTSFYKSRDYMTQKKYTELNLLHIRKIYLQNFKIVHRKHYMIHVCCICLLMHAYKNITRNIKVTIF